MKRDVIHAHCPVLAGLSGVTVYRVPHEPGVWGSWNPTIATYLLTNGKTWGVVDCGWPGKQGILVWERTIRELGLSWDNLEHILVTHSHGDHLGQAQTLSERSGRPVSIHPDALAEAAYYKRTGTEIDAAWAQFLVHAGHRQLNSAEPPPNPHVSLTQTPLPAQVENLVSGASVCIGDCVLEVLATPGHANGHICLVDSERRFAFAGDMVLQKVITSVVYLPGTTANPLGEYLESLARLEDCGMELILPAHGQPMANPLQRIREIRAYHAQQLALIRDRLALGAVTAAELAVSQPFQGRLFEDMSSNAKIIVLGIINAYLQLLATEGTVSSVIDSERGCQYFSLV